MNDVGLKQIIRMELDKISDYDSLVKIYTLIHTMLKMKEGDADDGI